MMISSGSKPRITLLLLLISALAKSPALDAMASGCRHKLMDRNDHAAL
ncbi:MAG: hypothetical protein R8K50_00495 [Mariprofundus sp.]